MRRRRGLCAAHDCTFLAAYCRTTYGVLLTATGRWREAEAELTHALEIYEQGHRALRAPAVIRLADLRISQGRFEEAQVLLRGYEDQGEALAPRALCIWHTARQNWRAPLSKKHCAAWIRFSSRMRRSAVTHAKLPWQ